jgi:WD40 repeat protein
MYEQEIAGAAFVPGDRWLAVMTRNSVAVWEASGWHERQRLKDERKIETVRFSPDGRRLATTIRLPTTGHDIGVELTRVFDLAGGNETGWEYTAPGGSNISQQFARDEAARRKQAVAGGDTASVRAAASSWPRLEVEEPTERVSADGVWKATVSGFVATLQDMAAKREVADFDHGGEITAVRFVPSHAPRWLVTTGTDGALAVWPLRTDDLVHDACTRLRAMFDPQALSKLIADAHAEGSCDTKGSDEPRKQNP